MPTFFFWFGKQYMLIKIEIKKLLKCFFSFKNHEYVTHFSHFLALIQQHVPINVKNILAPFNDSLETEEVPLSGWVDVSSSLKKLQNIFESIQKKIRRSSKWVFQFLVGG